MSAKWFDLRFEESPTKTRCDCQVCGRAMWFPPSKAGKYLTCGGECAEKRIERINRARDRNCETCGRSFSPRSTQLKSGGGRYCCVACAEPARAAGRTKEARIKSGLTRKASLKAGKFSIPTGPLHPSWKGGKSAYAERQKQKDPELKRQRRRAYMKANPAKVREWTQKRRGAYTGRLPKGTIKRIGDAQRWKCAACKCDISKSFHKDHIVALASGGKHEPLNIQLLCPTCNTRKSARHPVDFMQLMGYLL